MNTWLESRLKLDKISLLLILFDLILVVILYSIVVLSLYSKYKTYKALLFVDPVTGGMNYIKFLESARNYIKDNEKPLVAGYININDFRYINDYYGISSGDVVLKEVYSRLGDVLSDKGVYCRAVMDRFVFITECEDNDRFIYVLRSYMLNLGVKIDDKEILLKCSCGLYFIEDREMNVENIIDKASIARKLIKSNQAGSVNVYDKEYDIIFNNNKKYIVHMHDALKNGEFKTFVQPKISLKTGKCVGGEALVRWISPELGAIHPSEFVPLFEQNGFVTEIDFKIFSDICKDIADRIRNHKRVVKISVNQSRLHFNNQYYINDIESIIGDDGIARPYIEFELTESAFMERGKDVIEHINKLRKMGFSISIDDFGSGYSSLNMLRDMDFQVLKIDQAFLKPDRDDVKSNNIIKMIIDLAHSLDAEVVCEGVENKDQLEMLMEFGCDIVQGFYYAKPMTLEAFNQFLDEEEGIDLPETSEDSEKNI